ncbi:MAG: Protein transport protein S9 plasma membrane t-SNARE [Pycnora praestabilis]|nr:MAG: Protein transport protein S9 plasma membrane t-SNARE [Pycnora praestabilis]
MRKFGLGKNKSSDADADPNRSALFGSRSSKSSSPAPASSNPYAQPQSNAGQQDPYAQDTNKYAGMGKTYADVGRSSSGYGAGPGAGPQGPPSGRGGMNDEGYGDDRYGNQGGYGGDKYGAQGRYGSDRYGNQGGYGGNKYGGGAPTEAGGSKYGPGGYGGLGRVPSYDSTTTEDRKDALFGGARERYQKQATLPPSNSSAGDAYGAESGANVGSSQGYGAYEDRQLTAEEEEEEDVSATKQQIRFMKQEDVSSTRNALRIAAQAEETGRGTLERLGAQGERIHNTEKNLDLAANHNRVAEEKARELKTLNKSMFAMHVSNPFTASQRRQQRDDNIMSKHRTEREARDATRAAGFDSRQRMDGTMRELRPGEQGYVNKNKNSLAERAKYQFEADSEDDEMENEIDGNLDALSGAAGRLNALARATGKEVDEQNTHIERINLKSDRVDDQIAMNRARLDRIH